jgi:hypothetical protein
MKRKALGKGLSTLIPSSITRIPSPTAVPVPSLPRNCGSRSARSGRIRSSHGTRSTRRARRACPIASGAGAAAASRCSPGFERPVRADRWGTPLRAAQRAGIHLIPAVVRDVPDESCSSWRSSKTCNARN